MIVWERGAGGAGIVPESISCQVDLYPAVFVQDTTLRYGFPYRFFKGTVRGFMWGGSREFQVRITGCWVFYCLILWPLQSILLCHGSVQSRHSCYCVCDLNQSNQIMIADICIKFLLNSLIV